MKRDDAQRIVTISMLWLGFLVLASRPWTSKAGGTTDALGQVKAFVQGKVSK